MKFRFLIIGGVLLGLMQVPVWATPKPDHARAAHEVRELSVKGFDQAFLDEQTDFHAYRAVFVNDPSIEFHDRWLRDHRSDISRRDERRIRGAYSDALRTSLNKSLAAHGVSLAEGPGSGVLIVNAKLADFRLTAPDSSRGPLSRQFVDYVGSARLELALEDGAERRLLGSLSDFSQTRSHGALNDLKETNRVVNLRDFKMLFHQWGDHFAGFIAEQSR